MKIKFQADADLNQNIINAIFRVESKIDFQIIMLNSMTNNVRRSPF
jgi:hypothetical protein